MLNSEMCSGHRCDEPVERQAEPAGHSLPALRWCHGGSATGAERLPLPQRQSTSSGGVPEVPHPAGPEGEEEQNI